MSSAKPRYWLVKTEPESFSIDDWNRLKNKTTCWDGVRNYQARNILRDEMRIGDLVLVYHSNASPPGVVGLAEVAREAYPDRTARDPQDPHYDAKSTPDNPRWFMVDLRLKEVFAPQRREALSLEQLRQVAALRQMELLRKGSRLSVQPVRKKELDAILKLARA